MQTLIVNYHYCLTVQEEPYLARTAIAPERLAKQVAALSYAKARSSNGFDVAVTFDDGTKGNFRHALPVIRSQNMPAIMFVCSLPLAERRVLNVTKIHMLQAKLGFERFQAAVLEAANRADREGGAPANPVDASRLYRYDKADVRELKLLLNVYLPYPFVTRLLDELFERELGSQAHAVERVYMSVDDLRDCLAAGVHIGLHTHSHPMLSRLSRLEQEQEIAMPMEFLRDRLGMDLVHFAYPYGVETTWTTETKELLAHHGVREAYTLGRRLYSNDRGDDPLEIPRFDVNDVFDATDSVKPSLLVS